MNLSASNAETVVGEAAGVPFVAVPPSTPAGVSASVVVAWHMMDPPRTEAAFAAALPLAGLDAWRIYLGLPMHGSRTPAGGGDELMRLGYEDAVLNLHGPISHQAACEFEPALADLRRRLRLGPGPLGLVGGSLGAAVALLVLAESSVEVAAAVLVNPLAQMRRAVEAMSRRFNVTYGWSDSSRDAARRLDFVARAHEIARRPNQPAVLLVVGEQDDAEFGEAATDLRGALARHYGDPTRVALDIVPGMHHALAEEPGLVAAPQTTHAVSVDRLAVQWLHRHLAN